MPSTKLKKARFFIFDGPRANNGKSQVLDAVAGLFPEDARGSVSVEKWGDDRYVAQLVDVKFNRVSELSGGAIKSEAFKGIVSGDPITARDVYRSAVEFRAVALHAAATNKLPSFEGGFDRGVLARLLPISFNRSIPVGEQVEFIGQRIPAEEPDLLLAWAVEGGCRVIRNGGYTIPASSQQALDEWSQGADPVLGWLAECITVTGRADDAENPSNLLSSFRAWAQAEGYQGRNLPGPKAFYQRLLSAVDGIGKDRDKSGRYYTGVRIGRAANDIRLEQARRPDHIADQIPGSL